VIVLVALLIAVASVPITGGRLSRLGELRLRCTALLAGGFLLQLVTISVFPSMPERAARALHLVSYATAAVFFATNTEFANSQVLDNPRLLPLGDVFAVPTGWPLANVFSIGDVLLVAGAALVLHHLCRQPSSRPESPERDASDATPRRGPLGSSGHGR
jgi:hypothetical protein